MIEFISKYSPYFPFFEVKELYESYEIFDISGHNADIDGLLRRNEFYAVNVNGKFEGCFYIHNKTNDSCYLSGFAKRKAPVSYGIKEFLLFLKDRYKTVYSETKHRHARICLLRAGFKHYKDNIYKKEI